MARIQLSGFRYDRSLRPCSLVRSLLSSTALTRAAAAAGLFVVHPGGVLANPQGGVVNGGSATIRQTSPTRLDVNQSSQRAVIDWRSFDIGKGEHTNFNQPSSSAVALNRIGDQKASQIQGRLTANGQVFLINPNGIVFGPGSRVDVAGLIATTADIRNADFMAGRYRFDMPSSNRDAMVVNEGTITVKDRGLAALVAPGVANSGIINAKLGRVELAGATTFTVDLHGDGLMSFELGGKVAEAPRDASGNPLPALVTNSGKIAADGGTVHLTAAAAAGVVSNSINMSGVVEARAVTNEGGKIVLSGGDAGRVNVSGRLDASAPGVEQRGGRVEVLGDQVALLNNARIDVSGAKGGGTALVGGAFQGKGPQRNALKAYVASDVKINADALTWGNGGQVVVWSDQATYYSGAISARGGSQGGNGGLVEVSGKLQLGFYGHADVSAPKGESGTILLDPRDINIVYGSFGPDDSEVTDGRIFFGDENGETQDFRISESALEGLTGNVVLQASRDINSNASLNFTNQTTGERVVFQAGRNITLSSGSSNSGITTSGAAIILEADSPHSPPDATFNDGRAPADGTGTITINSGVTVASNGGNIRLIGADFAIFGTGTVINAGAGDIDIAPANGAPLTIGSGVLDPAEINLMQADLLTIGRAVTAGSSGLGDGDQVTAGSITINRSLAPAGTSNLYLISDGDVSQTGGEEGATITETRLRVSAGGAVSLEAPNTVNELGPSSSGHGEFSFDNSTSLTLTGPVSSVGLVSIDTAGDLTITSAGSVTGTDISLRAFSGEDSSIIMNDGSFIDGRPGGTSGFIFLGADTSIRASTLTTTGDMFVMTGPGGVTFAGSIDGARSLGVTTDGDIRFDGPVGANQRLGNIVVGDSGEGETFDINNPAIANPDTISGPAGEIRNLGGNIFIAGPFRAAGVILKPNTASAEVTSGADALDLSALFVDGRRANLFGRVDNQDGSEAARRSRTPSPPSNSAAVPGDFLLNGCVIGVGCPTLPPKPDVTPEPVVPFEPSLSGDPARVVLSLEKQLADLNSQIGREPQRFSPTLFAPDTARDEGDSLDLLSSSGNEELW